MNWLKIENMYQRIVAFVLSFVMMLAVVHAEPITITRVEPGNWWIGMKKTELQILVYGPNIAHSKLTITYPGITLKEVAKAENRNYLFVYINIAKSTKAGMVPLRFTNGL